MAEPTVTLKRMGGPVEVAGYARVSTGGLVELPVSIARQVVGPAHSEWEILKGRDSMGTGFEDPAIRHPKKSGASEKTGGRPVKSTRRRRGRGGRQP